MWLWFRNLVIFFFDLRSGIISRILKPTDTSKSSTVETVCNKIIQHGLQKTPRPPSVAKRTVPSRHREDSEDYHDGSGTKACTRGGRILISGPGKVRQITVHDGP